MEQIFAPWRIDWVERDEKISGCIFCKLPEKNEDKDSLIIARSEFSFVMLNNYPYNPGHTMVVPFKHKAKYENLTKKELLDHSILKKKTFKAIKECFNPDGFNSGLNLGEGSGGSISEHLHTHIVPRWKGDTNFMPVTNDTKVIVELVEDSYKKLYSTFKQLDGVTNKGDSLYVS